MERLETLLARLPAILPDQGLRGHILVAIAEARERQRVFREALFGVLAALSALSLVPATMYAMAAFSASSFAAYFSLIFTDSGVAFANWQTMLLSLIESIPLSGVTFVAAAAFALLISLKAVAPYPPPRRGFSYRAS